MTETHTLMLDRLIPGGQAIGTLPNGKKALVWGGLPGETVEVEVTKSKSSYLEGIVSKTLQASEHRVKPKDECYQATSPWQIMDYSYELEQKAELVREAFRQQKITLDKQLSVLTDGKDYCYRNKMEYSLYWDNNDSDEPIKLAFHKRGTHRKQPISHSSIERAEILTEAHRIVTKLNDQGKEARTYQSLIIRCNQAGQVSSALFKNRKAHPKMQALSDSLLGHEYRYSPNGFFQINVPVYEMALTKIKQHITADTVVDLYAGVGTIGLSVARNRNLTLVETDRSAFGELQANTKIALADNTTACISPIHAKSEDALDHIGNNATVILDPPRAGLDTRIITRIMDALPPSVIYLSCNPITQARDIAPLLKYYDIKCVQPFNFFPRTPHIENLVTLRHSSRKNR